MPTLFDPVRIGAIEAPNRIFMAPLTRARGTREHLPTPVMAEYYRQRASAGLIVSEATGISQEGLGWPFATGIWSDEQVRGWAKVTTAVHEAGGRIFCQLWHMGRVVHPSLRDGALPVSASATTAPGLAHTYEGKQPHAQARALDTGEIRRVIEDYRQAASNALKAGFDGVQIHAANGYLIDQFLRASANHRDDAYGGPIANRVRLLGEVCEAVAGIVGPDRLAVRLSPNGESQGVNDPEPEPLFVAAARSLSALGIAFLELREPPPDGTRGKPDHPAIAPAIRLAFKGTLVLNSDFDGTRASAAVSSGAADAITFGRPFLANPDLPARLRLGASLNDDDMETWYSQGIEGYLDYPALAG
ncbi:alkene reductase [Bosea sp. (in: a-proteobacteria)]|uniref:alkene reductase n=1 Tax=Bosea sp. (in: a-proteobacteria) TaxID=1871050 RepID=UPI001AC4F011|nr:alkene reductase [Bosea sp. (in: a-proteobacteria)]MBN9438303.1 alkene reductase [Bosea sp. (in: a-proteobacteria)]